MSIEIDLETHKNHAQRTLGLQNELAGEICDEMIENLGMPEVSDTLGTHQRYQLRVPTTEVLDGSIMSVGRRQDSRGYDGFGLTTVAHVGVSAEGGKDESKMTLQSNGQLIVRSDTDSAFVLSKGPALVASSTVTNIVASGGVVIAAGGSVPMKNDSFGGDVSPPVPDMVEKYAEVLDAGKESWSEWSGANEEAVDARDTLQDDADPDYKVEWADHQKAVEGADLAEKSFVSNNEINGDDECEGGGLALSGEGGFVIGTPEFGAMHAQKALTISSEFPSMVATDTLDLSASSDLYATAGGNIGIIASRALRVVSHEGDVQLATRTGDKVEVWAKAVHLGELEPDDPQEETTLVSLRAKERISFATDADAGRDEGDEGIFFETHELVEAKAETSITLDAGEEIIIKIKDEDYQFMVDSDGLLTIQSGETVMKISDDDGLIFEDDSETYLTASSDGAFLGIDSDNCIDISSDEVAIKGDSIEIG